MPLRNAKSLIAEHMMKLFASVIRLITKGYNLLNKASMKGNAGSPYFFVYKGINSFLLICIKQLIDHATAYLLCLCKIGC